MARRYHLAAFLISCFAGCQQPPVPAPKTSIPAKRYISGVNRFVHMAESVARDFEKGHFDSLTDSRFDSLRKLHSEIPPEPNEEPFVGASFLASDILGCVQTMTNTAKVCYQAQINNDAHTMKSMELVASTSRSVFANCLKHLRTKIPRNNPE